MKVTKGLIEKNFYELLDVKPGATDKEIEEAYHHIKNTYSRNSMASHSIFSRQKMEAIMDKLDKAYMTLKDPAKRSAYNMKLGYPMVLDTSMKEKNSNFRKTDINPVIERDYRKGIKIEFKKPLLVLDDPKSVAAEQYRILCARFQQASIQKSCKIFAITSALKGEGKTTTSVNLSYILAHEFKKKVLLIDGDMRNPSTPTYLEVKEGQGLIDILKGAANPASALLSLNEGNFSCLPTGGSLSDNPSEFLSSPRMKRLVETFKSQFDYVIIDAPPILPVVDMNILSDIVDGVILVVRADKTPRDLVLKALKSITMDNVVGIVLNAANMLSRRYYYYKY